MALKDQFGWDVKLKALEKANYDIPYDLADKGQRYFKQNFEKQQWNGNAWQPRLRETKASEGKPILVNTGRLKDAMNHTIVSFDYKKIVWRANVPYAGYLNFGTSKMVARPFIGFSPEMLRIVGNRINFAYKKVILSK